MLAAERHRRILDILQRRTFAPAGELKSELGINAMMLWRDLKFLSEQNLLRRVRGGVELLAVDREAPFQKKLGKSSWIKTRLASYAVRHFVKPGDVIILEGGTTVSEIAKLLIPLDVTVLTNSIHVVNRLNSSGAVCTAYCSGGLLRPRCGSFVGKEAVTFFSRRKATTFFMSATGLDEQAGITDPNPQEIEVKQAMIRSASRTVALIDASKLGHVSLMQVAPLQKIQHLITDERAGRLGWLAARGVKIESC